MRGFSLFLALALSLHSLLLPFFLSFFLRRKKAKRRREIGGRWGEKGGKKRREERGLSFLYSIQKAGMAKR